MVQAAVLSSDAQRRVERQLRILVLASKPHGVAPGQRFRLEQWAPRVERRGVRMDFVPFESPRLTELLYRRGHIRQKALWTIWDFLRRAVHVANARDYDAVIVYREAALLGPAFYERLLAWANVPMLFDFDDAIWLPAQNASVNGLFSRLHFYGKTATLCRLSDGVIAGNEYLASYARRQNERVFVIPTSIELEKYPVQPTPADAERFVIGWSGSQSTLAHPEHARVAVERLAERRPVTVRVVCNERPERPFEGAHNEFVRWSEAEEAAVLGRNHVGIMPLPDDDYTRGKCGLKALQFMACGVPVVVSPVGMNCDLVRSGENGMLASTIDEWVDALDRLASSRELRLRIGAAGRRTVEQKYSAEVVAEMFEKAVRSVVS